MSITQAYKASTPNHAATVPRFIMVLAVLLAGILFAGAGQLSTRSNYAAAPGSTNEVDLLIDDAAGVASIALKVNYDPTLLELLSVTNKPGSLGTNFSAESCGADGTATVILTRPDALISGCGAIATLLFRVNPGATTGMSCELPVVRHELGGQYGTVLEAGPTEAGSSGKIWIVPSMTTDSDGDGIPDAWEITNFGGPTNAAPDEDDDGDGQSNAKEYRCGTNPHDDADCLRIKHVAKNSQGGYGLVIRWASAPTVEYTVERTTNLATCFEGIASNIVSGVADGSYTDDTVTIEGPYFYRVLVK